MDLIRVCSDMKERLTRDLERERNPLAREALLLSALYEVGRDVLPALGTPRKSQQYVEAREAVLELATRIGVPLVRVGGSRSVVALSQLAEECQDPLLKKKLSVYAQELRAKWARESDSRQECSSYRDKGSAKMPPAAHALGLIVGTAVIIAVGLWLYRPGPVPEEKVPAQQAALTVVPAPKPARPAPAPQTQALCPVDQPRAAQPQPQKQEKLAPPPQGEQVTRVRVVDNQVLVPVVLRHGGDTAKLELLLDTGATRTAVHESVVTRLPLDLHSAKPALAEVADGRLIPSRVARIDQLSVGPFSHPALEVELIPYAGEGKHDGLLGMDVLGRHRYQIDMEHELIRWY